MKIFCFFFLEEEEKNLRLFDFELPFDLIRTNVLTKFHFVMQQQQQQKQQ